MTANSVVNQIFQSESFVLQKGLNCTNSTIQGVGTADGLSLYKPTIQGGWYTRRPFPVQTHDSMQLVHQTAFPCTNSTIQGDWYTRRPFPVQTPRFKAIGTPDGLSLYKPTTQGGWYTRKPFPVPNPRFKALVHQTAFSCTNSNHQIE